MDLVPANARPPSERMLAPWLFERCRRHWASLLVAGGKSATGLVVMTVVQPVTNEAGASLYLRLFANPGDDTELAAIARDYAAHRARLGSRRQNDTRARCIMAAFAGRMIDCAAQRLGPHVRDELRAELGRLMAEDRAP